jgi:hypothetical protein
MLSTRRVAWIAGNAVAAFALPALFVWWLEWQTRGADAFEPEKHNPTTVVAAFTAAWWIFLLGLNATLGLFLWFRRQR